MAITGAAVRRRIVDHFVTAGATSAQHPTGFAPGGRRERWLFARMVSFGAVVEAGPGPGAGTGSYWLDERRLADFRKESVAMLIGAVAIAGLAAAGAIAVGG